MKILNMTTITGPNVYHHRPVLIMDLHLEELSDTASTDIEQFTERLVSILPGLQTHHCSPGHEGGFIERLKRGTYFAHMIEHIALELSELAGIGVSYGKSIFGGEPGHYKVIVRFLNEDGMKYLLKSAVELSSTVAQGLAFDLESCIKHAKYIIRKSELGPSATSILAAAKKRNIPWKVINSQGLIQLGHGKFRQYFQSTTTGQTSDIAVDIAEDKNFTKKLLQEAAIRVPRGRAVHSMTEALEVLNEIPVPLAIKPLDGNHGRGVTLEVRTPEEVKAAFLNARKHSDIVLIEECLIGKDYRLVVVGGKLVAAAVRTPAHVKGDGTHTIKELIDLENLNPQRGEGHEMPLTKILLNGETEILLARSGKTAETIPAQGEIVFLKETANLSTGGTAVDVTAKVHPEICFMCERAARIVGLDVCGVDLVAEDISLPLTKQSGGIIELNAGPGIRMHHYPAEGESRDVGAAIIDHLYPNNISGRIPIVAITGTNGKTTVSRLLAHIVSGSGKCVGNTTTDGIWINNVQVAEGDTTGPISANTVLTDPTVEFAVLETARGGIVKRGLGYDWSDVGVFTNVKLDHVGQDGIETIDDILRIKSLVIERVKPGGTIIVNADTPEIVKYMEENKENFANRKIIYFSLHPGNRIVRDHLENGGHAYFLRNDQIIEAQSHHESRVALVDQIPLTLGGTALFHVANAIAAIAAAHASGIEDEVILNGLRTFGHQKNQGRTNLFHVGKGYLLLDYGHNADAITSIGEMGKKWNVSTTTAIITAPGDRSDEVIKLAGSAAAWVFDKVIVREDADPRGRARGVISQMIAEAIQDENVDVDCKIIMDSAEALHTAVAQMQKDELVVFFYEDYKEIEKVLAELNVSPLTELDNTFFKKDAQPAPEGREEWLQYSS
jgi:cyanophycin synthetase